MGLVAAPCELALLAIDFDAVEDLVALTAAALAVEAEYALWEETLGPDVAIPDMPELLPVAAVVPEAPEAVEGPETMDDPISPDEPEICKGRIPVAVPPAMVSLAALWVTPFITPAAVAKPPKPEYVCK